MQEQPPKKENNYPVLTLGLALLLAGCWLIQSSRGLSIIFLGGGLAILIYLLWNGKIKMFG